MGAMALTRRGGGKGAARRLMLAAAAAALLAGCEDGQLAFGAADGDAPVAAAQSVALVERDVEAPEVFQVTDAGLWDGRPSLGGVWVAHPDVTDPERVIIRNQENGSFVIGALFRRERENPGPSLQVSSDAAEALGMLAGAPAQLNVTALRREEAADPAPPEVEALPPADGAEAAAIAPAGEITAAPLDAVAGAAAAIDAAEAAGVPGTAAEPAAPPPPPAPAPASGTLERPYIQLGIFSVKANADGLVQDMDVKGIAARAVETQSQGSTFWRVLVGPAASAAERDRLLEQVKAEGFTDAYFVRN